MNRFILINPMGKNEVARIGSGTQIDFMLVDESLKDSIGTVKVLEDVFSDHQPVKITIRLNM